MLDLLFEAGEVRRIEFKAKSRRPWETLVIASAGWRLWDAKTGEQLSSGSAEIRNDSIVSLVPLLNEGRYIFEVTAQIPPEVIKERLDIRVVQ